jgi:hypothetical protein
MLKLQIPKDQVLQRMKKEGIEERSSLLSFVKLQQSGAVETKDDSKNGNKLVSLHWTPLSGKALDKSVWNASKKQNVASTQPEGSDISKLVELFPENEMSPRQKTRNPTSLWFDGESQTLDLTRSNNVAISLKAFRENSLTRAARDHRISGPNAKIGGCVEFLRDLLPLRRVKIIKAYDGSERSTRPAETWFQEIADIKRIESKLM